MRMRRWDFVAAYLQGELEHDEVVYCHAPPGNNRCRRPTAYLPRRETNLGYGPSRPSVATVLVPLVTRLWLHAMRFGSMCFYHDQGHRWR
eukprot:1860905-Pleurochrysis_carterae.AAC.1